MSTENKNLLVDFSNALADATETAGAATVLVNARRRFPASGIAYAPDLILTADHVVEREDDIIVGLPSGEELKGRLVGRDAGSDLALLRLENRAAAAAPIFDGEVRVGQLVLALGRPSKSGIQASLGVISAKGSQLRTGRGGMLRGYLATDAVPLPGFSGGPLVDAAGNIVGMNTSGLRRETSLAIPIQLAWEIAKTLAEHGRIRHGYLGIRSQAVSLPAQAVQPLGRQQSMGLLLIGIEEGSPAAAGGLIMGDILVAIDNRPLNDPDDLSYRLSGELVGKQVQVEILRGGQPVSLPVIIGERR
jgi:S1-C subfamily serine protease